MLSTQIQYWSLVETSRHNQVEETETNRHNVSVETETKRHNLATENYNDRVLEYNYNVLKETERHNKAVEQETHFRNLNDYTLGYGSLLNEQERTKVQWYNAQTSRMQAKTAAETLANTEFIQRQQLSLGYTTMWNNYNIAQEQNRIASENAATNRTNAEVNQYNAVTQRRRQQADAEIGMRNASTNALNASTSIGTLQVAQQSQRLSERRYLWQQWYDQANINLGYANIAANLGNTLIRTLGQVVTKTGMTEGGFYGY